MMPIPKNSQKSGLKRKIKAPTSSRKKTKIEHHSLETLPWKAVFRPTETGLDGDDGVLDLEEVEDVEVVYEQTDVGRVVKFNVSLVLRRPSDRIETAFRSLRSDQIRRKKVAARGR
jgi:ATP-dependent RNA helicase DDX24/MAK5